VTTRAFLAKSFLWSALSVGCIRFNALWCGTHSPVISYKHQTTNVAVKLVPIGGNVTQPDNIFGADFTRGVEVE